MSLLYISQQVTIYAGLFLVVAGIIGNSINILVFSSIRSYRTNPSTFYFLIASIHNLAYIAINLVSRVVSAGYGIDLSTTSVIWCKIRQFCLFSLSLLTITCSCLATIDQFFTTSQEENLRRLSNIKWAHQTVFIVMTVWYFHGIPPALIFNISSITNTCVNMNAVYAIYILIYLVGLLCIIPVIVMMIFAYLTYRNIHLTRGLVRQNADRQLVRMTLFQVLLAIVSFIPYGIYSAYNLITSGMVKDTTRLQQEYFAVTVLRLVPYCYFAGNCYMFLLSSSRFRRSIKDRIFLWRRRNQINPIIRFVVKEPTLENVVSAIHKGLPCETRNNLCK